jgi:hypothetical protein
VILKLTLKVLQWIPFAKNESHNGSAHEAGTPLQSTALFNTKTNFIQNFWNLGQDHKEINPLQNYIQ